MNISTKSSGAPLGLRIAAGLVMVGVSFPTAYLIWRNISSGAEPIQLVTSARVLGPLRRTLTLAVSVSAVAGLVGTSMAWLSTRTDLPGRRWWRLLLPLPLVFPTFIGAAAFIRTVNPGGFVHRNLARLGVELDFEFRGFFGAWLVLVLFTYPYVYLPVAARLRRLPGSIEESARVLGDSLTEAFGRVVLPQLVPSMTAGMLLVFLYTISDFGAVQLMRYDTLTRAIETNYLARPPVAFSLSLVLLVLAALVVVAERAVTRRMDTAATSRSSRPVAHNLGWARPVALAATITVVGLSVVAPVVALIGWAIDGITRSRQSGRALALDADAVFEATWNTLRVSVVAAVVAVAAVLPIAYLVGRFRSRFANLAHAAVIATFALPGILIALSLRFWTLRSGIVADLFSNSEALLAFAYVVRFASLAMGVVLVAVSAVPDRLRDAAATLGADRWRRLVTVHLPIMRPGLAAAAGLVLLSTMKELPISLILSPIGFTTLTTRIFGSFEEAYVAEAGIMALLLVTLSAALTWFLILRRADHMA